LPARDSKASVESYCNFREFDHCSPGRAICPLESWIFFVAWRLQGPIA
jgi:hypothetical protein